MVLLADTFCDTFLTFRGLLDTSLQSIDLFNPDGRVTKFHDGPAAAEFRGGSIEIFATLFARSKDMASYSPQSAQIAASFRLGIQSRLLTTKPDKRDLATSCQ